MSTPAGWYDDGTGRQRWFDGTQWTEHVQDVPPATPPTPLLSPGEPTAPTAAYGASAHTVNPYAAPVAQAVGPKRAMGLAVAALVVGIVAFLSGLVPVWGIIAGAAALGLGIFALVRGQSKPLSIIGAVLGGLALLTSVIVTIALFASPRLAPVPDADEPVATAAPTRTPAPSSTPTATPTAEPTPEAPAETLAQANAKRKAQDYLNVMSFSRIGLIGQLEFEGFAIEDATYGVDALNVDWSAQAAKKAQEYLDTMAFSRSELVDQLIFEGFTPEEAEFGVVAVGY